MSETSEQRKLLTTVCSPYTLVSPFGESSVMGEQNARNKSNPRRRVQVLRLRAEFGRHGATAGAAGDTGPRHCLYCGDSRKTNHDYRRVQIARGATICPGSCGTEQLREYQANYPGAYPMCDGSVHHGKHTREGKLFPNGEAPGCEPKKP
jgi:hypothetical protein